MEKTGNIEWWIVRNQILHFGDSAGKIKLEGTKGTQSYYFYSGNEKKCVYWSSKDAIKAQHFLELNLSE